MLVKLTATLALRAQLIDSISLQKGKITEEQKKQTTYVFVDVQEDDIQDDSVTIRVNVGMFGPDTVYVIPPEPWHGEKQLADLREQINMANLR